MIENHQFLEFKGEGSIPVEVQKKSKPLNPYAAEFVPRSHMKTIVSTIWSTESTSVTPNRALEIPLYVPSFFSAERFPTWQETVVGTPLRDFKAVLLQQLPELPVISSKSGSESRKHVSKEKEQKKVHHSNAKQSNRGFEVTRFTFEIPIEQLHFPPHTDIPTALNNHLRIVFRMTANELPNSINVKSTGHVIGCKENHLISPDERLYDDKRELAIFVFNEGFRINDYVDYELVHIHNQGKFETILSSGSLTVASLFEEDLEEEEEFYFNSNYDSFYVEPTTKVTTVQRQATFEGRRIKEYIKLSNPRKRIPVQA